MFRTRLFGASLVLSVLINIGILAAVGDFGWSSLVTPERGSLKPVELAVYHPSIAKSPVSKPRARSRPLQQARRPAIPHHALVARATPAPPSLHPDKKIARSHPASLGRRPVRVAAAIRLTTPSTPAVPAHEERPVHDVSPAPQMPKVETANNENPVSAPTPSQNAGSGAGAVSAEAAPASGSAGGNGDYERIGAAPGPGGEGGGGPFGIGPGGGGEGPRHIVYVLDVSPSMKTRIERARRELRDALATLESGESFDIIAFGGDIKPFSDQLLPADQVNIDRANQFLDKLDFIPGTDLQSALYAALAIKDVNVVFVITDGVPTMGETDFGKIARHIRKHNGTRARIYTVGLVGKNPDGTDESFEAGQLLQQLAKDSGGDSRLVPLGEATPDE